MKRRFLAAILCLSLLLSNDSLALIANSVGVESAEETSQETAQTTEATVSISLDGCSVTDFRLEATEKKTLIAALDGAVAEKWQWQIRAEGVWVNILDKTTADCDVTYALIGNVLDSSDCARLRCAVTDADGQTHYSQSVTVALYEQASVSLADDGDTGSTQTTGATETTPEYVTITINYVFSTEASEINGLTEAAQSYVAKVAKDGLMSASVVFPTVVGYSPTMTVNGAETSQAVDAVKWKYSSGTLTVTTTDEKTTLDTQTGQEAYTVTVYYERAEVNYTVRYYFQNIYDDLYTEDESLYKVGTALTGTTIEDDKLDLTEDKTVGFTKLYHVPAAVAADGSTVFECYYDREYYLIIFDCDGGYGVEPIYARYGTSFIVNTPTRYGYTFKGWWDGTSYDNDEEKSVCTPPTEISNWETSPTYIALWEQTLTTTSYTVAYWVVGTGENGSNQFIGSKVVENVDVGTAVWGENDLLDSDNPVCGMVESDHEHTVACYKVNHTHTANCFNTTGKWETTTISGSEDNAIINLLESLEATTSGATGENGYIYRIQKNGESTLWLKLRIGDQWYSYNDAPESVLADLVCVAETDYTDSNNIPWHGWKYYANLKEYGCNWYYDDAITATCGLTAHTHTSSCYFSDSYTSFYYADGTVLGENGYSKLDDDGNVIQDTDNKIIVADDGTTVVNVYYKNKEYTLRFYYARSYDETTTTTGDDGTTVTTTNTIYQVVGGSTYYFTTSGDTSGCGWKDAEADAKVMLEQMSNASRQWGTVVSLPEITEAYWGGDDEEGEARRTLYGLKKGTLESSTYTYYYFQFTASYGADISDIWPVDLFEPVSLGAGWTGNAIEVDGKTYTYSRAYFSAWNGQLGVKYTQDNKNSNQTIKGTYQHLDENLIFDITASDGQYANYADDTVISYLCFWENGAGTAVDWSVPKVFDYKLYKQFVAGIYIDEGITLNASGYLVDKDGKEISLVTADGNTMTLTSYNGTSYYTYTVTTEETDSDSGEVTTTSTTYYYRNGYLYTADSDGNLQQQGECEVYYAYSSTGSILLSQHSNKWYYIYKDFDVYDNSSVGEQTTVTLDGYTMSEKVSTGTDDSNALYVDIDGKGTLMRYYRIDFYYDAKTSTQLIFYNKTVRDPIDDIAYGTTLATASGILDKYVVYVNGKLTLKEPAYPASLEAGAYEFTGWYTTAECYENSKFDLLTETMPADDLALYAGWSKKTYTVNFFASKDDLEAYEKAETAEAGSGGDYIYTYTDSGETVTAQYLNVAHGDTLPSVPTTPTYQAEEGDTAEYTFAGWFYIDSSGTKKAYTPLYMPVKDNLQVFAEWKSNVAVEYTIKYQLEDGTPVAADTVGQAYVGTTRTFQALAGGPLAQLNGDYNTCYYPDSATKSLTMSSNAEDNVCIFVYTKSTGIGYTVKYVDSQTGETRADTLTVEAKDNQDAVVIVQYKPVSGYVPDAYYKQLVLSSDESLNVITFYYTASTTQTIYSINFMLGKQGVTTSATDVTTDQVANVYSSEKFDFSSDSESSYVTLEYNATAEEYQYSLDIDLSLYARTGFTVYSNVVVVQGSSTTVVSATDGKLTLTLDSDGAGIYLFYGRISYNYTVKCVKYGDATTVLNTETGSAQYGAELTITAPTITGYTCTTTSKTLTVRDNSDYTEATDKTDLTDCNEVIFEYTQNNYNVYYVPVVDGVVVDGAIWLSQNQETFLGGENESVSGCTAFNNDCYTFKGWYYDTEGNNPVGDGSDGTEKAKADGYKLTPNKDNQSNDKANYYYALYTVNKDDLTITLSGEKGEVFVFELKNDQTGVTITVTVTIGDGGTGSATVQAAHWSDYTLTLISGPWRYSMDTAISIEHKTEDGTEEKVEMTKQEGWLSHVTAGSSTATDQEETDNG